MKRYVFIYITLIVIPLFSLALNAQEIPKDAARFEKKALRRSDFVPELFSPWNHLGKVTVDSIKVDRNLKTVDYYLSPSVTHIPVRTLWLEKLRADISAGLGRPFREYRVNLLARNRLLEDYVPIYFRDTLFSYDAGRRANSVRGPSLVNNLNKPAWAKGLAGRHIAVWPSHGIFYDQQLQRWQWQRARLWQTVEDLLPWTFTIPYLVPMLENAGATVLIPRERDIQNREVIVDNDLSTGSSELLQYAGNYPWNQTTRPGFCNSDTLFPGQNPFNQGTGLFVEILPADTASLVYIPDIPVPGEYAVYVSWIKSNNCISDAHYEVNYTGGTAVFEVNQCMGSGTWIYLGTFHFNGGKNRGEGSVILHGGSTGGVLTADAVRFGGGMGNIARIPGMNMEARQKPANDGITASSLKNDATLPSYTLSGKPRWMEGSRYYLQYAGMPDSLVYNLSAGKNDYNDDYMCRGEWVNYLCGSSRPQYTDKYENGLNIPVDMVLAFHTDAGVTDTDSVVGTLGIYSATRNQGFFPDGRPKLASRDLADIIQTQVVDDIRALINPEWTRRGLWDREYSEAWRPIVPVMLLELLSHQNLADMKFGLDPRFKFIVSRSIYKGVVRYLAAGQGTQAIIQPLPPDHMAIEAIQDLKIRVSWRAVPDQLEPSALPDGYMIYRKEANLGFDAGTFTRDTFLILDLPEWGKLYSFSVTAVNRGGESMPGETLSVGLLADKIKPVLIVNAFNRICAPAFFDKGDMAGIAWWEDEGVAHIRDNGLTGYQYNFDRGSDWLNDDSQGWGASSADMEMDEVTGNTFSNPLIHGEALLDAGYSFISVSDEVFESGSFPLHYPAVDIIFGEERGTPSFSGSASPDFRVLTPALMKTLERYLSAGGNVFISGAYIGTDMVMPIDSVAIRFAANMLHYTWRTHHATRLGKVYATDEGRFYLPHQLEFNTGKFSGLYAVESPDAIEPADRETLRIYRYTSGDCSAGIAYKGRYRTVVLGFPFETITDASIRKELMEAVMKFFETSPPAPSPSGEGRISKGETK